MDWLWQGLLTNGLWALLLFGGGIVVAILRAKKQAWATPVLYGIGTVVCLAVIVFTFTGRPVFSKPLTEESNIEEKIKDWSAHLGFALQPAAPAQEPSFAYRLIIPNGDNIIVVRDATSRPQYIQAQSSIVLTPEQSTALSKLTKDEQDAVTQEVQLELSRTTTSFILAGVPLQSIGLNRPVPIAGLTETSFTQALDQLDNTIHMVQAIVPLAIKHNSHPVTPPPAHRGLSG